MQSRQQPRQPPFNMQWQSRQPPLNTFNMQSQTALLKNRINQAAVQAKQFVSGAAGSVVGAVNAFTNPNANNNYYAASNPVKANRFASSGNNGSGSGVVDDGEYKIFTRDQLNKLYGNQQKRGFSFSFMNTDFFNLGEGPIEHMIMMFQLYIALIAALGRLSMNAASMSTSFIFGNETLINIFSIFLENALNLILNRNVADMSLEQLHQSLVENKPKLQQMSALLIKEITELALGLSDVCSKIATSWVTDVLPGLLKSSIIGASSAAEAGINATTMGAFGELVEIFSTGAATIAGMMKIIKGFQSNYGNFSEAYGKVSNAYDGIIKLKELFSKPPSEIVAAATKAAIPEAANAIAEKVVDRLSSPGNPNLPGSAAGLGASPSTSFKSLVSNATDKGVNYLANAGLDAATNVATKGLRGLKVVANAIRGKGKAEVQPSTITSEPPPPAYDPSKVMGMGSPPANNSGDKAAPPSESSIRNLANKIKENFGTVKDIASKFGITVTGLSDLAEKIRTNSKLALFLAQRFGMTVTKIQASMLTRLADEIKDSGDPENATVRGLTFVEKNIRPIATGLNKVSTHLDNASNFIYKKGGSKRRGKNKMKSRKYLKNKKHFKKYMSNLRRKTAKKELDLLNGIRDFKSMISL